MWNSHQKETRWKILTQNMLLISVNIYCIFNQNCKERFGERKQQLVHCFHPPQATQGETKTLTQNTSKTNVCHRPNQMEMQNIPNRFSFPKSKIPFTGNTNRFLETFIHSQCRLLDKKQIKGQGFFFSISKQNDF